MRIKKSFVIGAFTMIVTILSMAEFQICYAEEQEETAEDTAAVVAFHMDEKWIDTETTEDADSNQTVEAIQMSVKCENR